MSSFLCTLTGLLGLPTLLALSACGSVAEHADVDDGTRLYLDEHRLDPSELSVAGVADAHAKDLALEGARGVDYERYWVDRDEGLVFCLVRAPSAQAAVDVHRDAHGLVPDEIREVAAGILPARGEGGRLFLDVHELGPGLRATDVAEAHRKDLAAQGAHGVRFLDYWVDEAGGQVHCLAEAPDAAALVATHREAHGLVPAAVHEVVEGH